MPFVFFLTHLKLFQSRHSIENFTTYFFFQRCTCNLEEFNQQQRGLPDQITRDKLFTKHHHAFRSFLFDSMKLVSPEAIIPFSIFLFVEEKSLQKSKNYFEAFCEFWLLPIERMLIIHWNATRKFIIELWEQIFLADIYVCYQRYYTNTMLFSNV